MMAVSQNSREAFRIFFQAKTLLAGGALLWLTVGAGRADGALETLAQVRELPRVAESVGVPLTVRGVVLQSGGRATNRQDLVVHDGTAAIYVVDMPADPVVCAGDRVEVELLTELGRYAMMTRGIRMVRLGEGALPEPSAATLGELRTGVLDGQWVRVRGVVAAVVPMDETLMVLNTEQGMVSVFTVSQGNSAELDRLIDSEVTVDGVCLPVYNMREELLGVRVRINGLDSVRTLSTPEGDPFAVPEADAAHLSPFSTQGPVLNRRQFSGVVTAVQDERVFYLYAKGRGIKVSTASGVSPSVGDRLDVSGFVDRSEAVAGLLYAVFRKTGVSVLPSPVTLSREEAFHLDFAYDVQGPDYYARLVTVEGALLGTDLHDPENRALLLDWEGFPLRVRLGRRSPPPIRTGSLLRVTGVCLLDYSIGPKFGGGLSVRNVSLLPGEIGDIVVVRQAPWWTTQRLVAAIALLLLTVAGVTLWSLLLKRQVERGVRLFKSEEAARLEAELRRDERTRIAADLHDTLEQNLTSMMLQVWFAEKAWKTAPEKLSEFFRVTSQAVTQAKANLRSSVWNLRSEELREKKLTCALEELPKAHPGHEFVLDLYAVADDIPPERAAQVYSVVQEAVTNAVKHAEATEIAIIGEPFQGKLKLLIQDNGRGFDVEKADSPATGHFGLAGMRERMGRIGGAVVVESAPGHGTVVMVIYDGLREGVNDDSCHAG